MQLKTTELTARLTPRQAQLLKIIAGFQANRCYLPTIAEIASELGVSRSTAFEHILELRKKNLISPSPGKARSLELTTKAQELLNCLDDSAPDFFTSPPAGISLLGRVAAGTPIEAIENKDSLSLNSYFDVDDDTFALEVKGDSMINEGIYDGDYVICRRSPLADNGQLVVAILDNENATLKKFYKEKTCVRLQPANDDYQPIYSNNCRIEAVVIGLIRKF